MELHELTAAQAAAQVKSRVISATELVEALLARIHRTDADLQAWETLVVERALLRARRADTLLTGGTEDQIGLLHGVPFGVKDVIATAGIRTACGFGPFNGRIPAKNADVVGLLQREGAILLGKTVTTQFAWAQPSRTYNPWALDRTPGGSSSGSAAAVAARQVPLALGTQTAGSTLRPAAYNGVVGFKPSIGRVSTRGVFPLAKSLDHVGCIARSVEDCRLFLAACGSPNQHGHALGPKDWPPTIGVLREAVDLSSSHVVRSLESVIKSISDEGGKIREIALQIPLATAISAHRMVINYEAALLHKRVMKRYSPDGYAPKTLEYIAAGNLITRAQYLQAQLVRKEFVSCLDSCLSSIDALILPTVVDVAPDRATTGIPSLQTPFTFAGTPAISLPSGLSPDNLPIGMQLVGRHAKDEHLLSVAQWCERLLAPLPAPHALMQSR